MLGVSGFPPLCKTTTHHHTISQFFPVSDKTHLSFPSNCLTHQKFYPIRPQIRSKLCVSGLKSRSKESNSSSLLEIEGLDDEEDDDDYDEEEEEEDEDGDEGGFVPLKNMKEWLANKPTGFGQGKDYDTSVEDKLLEEMERSRAAQLANLNKLKNSPETSPNSKKEAPLQKQIVLNVVPSGIRVRLPNLPKKKNVHRDLKLAFKGFPGILNISPAVIGNKKTRDPVCKGYAFVDFKSQEDANRFIKAFSGQSISFGKIQKEITCEIVKSKSPHPELTQPRIKSVALPRLPGEDLVSDSGNDDTTEDASESEGEESPDDNKSPTQPETVSETLASSPENSVGDTIKATTEITVDSLASENQETEKKRPEDDKREALTSAVENSVSDTIKATTEITMDALASENQETEKKKPEDDKREALTSAVENSVSDTIKATTEITMDALASENQETEKKKPEDDKREALTSAVENSVSDSIEATTEITLDSLPTKKQETDQAVRKKKTVNKRKATKGPKLSIPGSANRLKVKEKAMLTDVFSKYAMKSASTLKRGS